MAASSNNALICTSDSLLPNADESALVYGETKEDDSYYDSSSDEDELDLTLITGIEVEAIISEGSITDKIICTTSKLHLESGHRDRAYLVSEQQGPAEGRPSSGIEYSLLDNLSLAYMNTLTCGEPFLKKSILRTSNSKQAYPGAGPPLSDRSVSFSQLKIREFDMTLGNHPSATSGPPVMLDWDNQKVERVVSLDEYERARLPRRSRKKLKLSYKDRKGILQEGRGFSESEVNEAWAAALRIRKQRQETLERGLLLMAMDDVWESTCRKYRKLTDGFIGAW